MGRLDGKIALITGGGGGIGGATAKRFAAEGARVIVTDLKEADAARTVATIGSGEALAHDVTREADWRRVLDHIADTHGRLDILVNNAGILATGNSQNVESTDMAQWRAVQSVNVDGVYLGCQLAVEAMKGNGGAIVNLSSIAGLIGTPQLFAYGASKGAVRQLTKSVAAYCARAGYGIRCNSVHPGLIDTGMGDAVMALDGADPDVAREARKKMVPMGEIGTPDHVASCILFLVSDDAAYVTGAELVVDGGFTIL